jgi:uncharacterized protein YndB with AHSA1/START domain
VSDDQPASSRPPFDPVAELFPLALGAAAGLLLRLVFNGKPGEPYSAMMLTFIFLAPVLVGIVTVFAAQLIRRRTFAYSFWVPSLANLLYVAASVFLQVEGWICAILYLPIAVVVGGLGGLLMFAISGTTKQDRNTLYGFAALPLVLGALEARVPLPERIGTLERTLLIDAPPADVWKHLMDADHIQPAEVDRAWMYRIGVPTPLAGVTHATRDGLAREITMGKGIHFQQVSSDWQPQRYVHWQYRFTADSVPAGALDDHVRIGGHYFDLKGTTYTLTPRGDATQLTIRMQYRVSTQFNWYAEPIAALLIGNFEEVILDFYRQRSEA